MFSHRVYKQSAAEKCKQKMNISIASYSQRVKQEIRNTTIKRASKSATAGDGDDDEFAISPIENSKSTGI